MVAFARSCFNGQNDFEAILVNFCSYDYNPSASEAVQMISTRKPELYQLTKKANFIATLIKKYIQQFIACLLEIQARFLSLS